MYFFKIFVSLFVFFALASSGSFGAKRVVFSKEEKEKRKKDTNIVHTFEKYFFEGIKYQNIKDYEKALEYFEKADKTIHDKAIISYKIASIYFTLREFDLATFYATRAVKISPNKWYKHLLANSHYAENNITGAKKSYLEIVDKFEENYSILENLIRIYYFEGDLGKVFFYFNELEKSVGTSPEIFRKKKDILLQIGQPQRAEKEIQKALKLYPSEYSFYQDLISIYYTYDSQDSIKQLKKTLLESAKDDPRLLLPILEYNSLFRLTPDEYTSFLITFIESKTTLNENIATIGNESLLNYTINYEKLQEIEDALRKRMEKTPTFNKFNLFLARIEFIQKEYESAKISIKKYLKKNKKSYLGWLFLLDVFSSLRANDSVISTAQEAQVLFLYEPIFYLYEGSGFFQKKDYKQAIKVLRKGASLTEKKPALKIELYSLIASAYSESGDLEQCIDFFEKCLELDSNNPLILNNYSYILSVNSKNLSRAEKMSQKANILEPNRSTFQDTHAWVLYKRNRFTEAEMWIKRAILNQKDNEESVIYEHYGDILEKLEKKEDAIEAWRKAISINDENKEEIEKKIHRLLNE